MPFRLEGVEVIGMAGMGPSLVTCRSSPSLQLKFIIWTPKPVHQRLRFKSVRGHIPSYAILLSARAYLE